MKVLLFGATGMVGQGVLTECLADDGVTEILCIGRGATGRNDAKLSELARPDLLDYEDLEEQLAAYDACFFCLGATAAGKTEGEYAAINYEIPLAIGRTLARVNPHMGFVYVSGQGTDSSEKGRVMWARVKGRTENALLKLDLNAYMFRPGAIEPSHGEVSRTWGYRTGITLMKPLFPLLHRLFPGAITTTGRIGQAMLKVVRGGYPVRILESKDINAAA